MKINSYKQQQSLVDIEQLRTYPPGTFGRATAEALDKHSLKPFTLGLRRVQLHDGLHALLGYGVDPIDEARVQAFLLGTQNRLKLVNMVLLTLLLGKVIRQLNNTKVNTFQSRQDIIKAMQSAYSRGCHSTLNPDTWQPEQLWHLPLEQVRSYFSL